MKKCIILYFSLLTSVALFAQNVNCIPSPNINYELIKEALREENYSQSKIKPFLQETQVDSLIVMRDMHFYVDKETNTINFNVDENEAVLFSISNNENLYSWDQKNRFITICNPTRTFLHLWSLRIVYDENKMNNSIDMNKLFEVILFPDEKYDNKYFAYKPIDSNELHIIDQKFNIFYSLDEFLRFYFGSKENYIETYKYKQNRWKKKPTLIDNK